MRREQLDQIFHLIQAMPYWEQTAQLKAMAYSLQNHCSSSEIAQVQRMRASVERLMHNDPLMRLHEVLVEAERALEEETLLVGEPS